MRRTKNRALIPVGTADEADSDSKAACAVGDRYDAQWKDDPNVKAWSRDAG
jgi:hypothetical protein